MIMSDHELETRSSRLEGQGDGSCELVIGVFLRTYVHVLYVLVPRCIGVTNLSHVCGVSNPKSEGRQRGEQSQFSEQSQFFK